MSGFTSPKPLRIVDGISRLLRDLIHESTGIFFEDSRLNDLLEKLDPIAQELDCQSFLEYFYRLKDNDSAAWDATWEALSVQETYFWREMAQIHALVETVVPALFARGFPVIRIWSAACATGEEPYSIAMALAEAGFGSQPIEIVGSDASPLALEKARNAVYREKSFRSLPAPLRQKYFEPVEGGWKLSPAVTAMVKWQRANLTNSAEISPLARAHAIFCRNAFIYFSRHSVRQTVAIFAARMTPGSHLFVGASESLLKLTTDFELKEISNAFVYVRI